VAMMALMGSACAQLGGWMVVHGVMVWGRVVVLRK
jgi:hypothetical protein